MSNYMFQPHLAIMKCNVFYAVIALALKTKCFFHFMV